MPRHLNIPQKAYMHGMQFLGNWFTREHIILLLTGKLDRIHSAEVVLPRLVKRGLLKQVKFHQRFAYAVRRVSRSYNDEIFIEHGLGCTEGLVRFWISDRSGELIRERKFKSMGICPEWALRYPSGKLLLYEFCTEDNSKRIGVIKSKITRYQKIMKDNYVIVFVMDLPRKDVIYLVEKIKPEGPFMFTDYETFKTVPYGDQLTASIYLWGGDVQPHPLREYA